MRTRTLAAFTGLLGSVGAACTMGAHHVGTAEVEPAATTAEALSAGRGLGGDLIADVEVGRRDFTEDSERSITPDKVENPGGVAIDRTVSPGRAYVWDSGNSRILGLDLSKCYAVPAGQRCTAQLVFGQPSGSDHGGCNRDSSAVQFPGRPAASASTLCGVSEITHTVLEDKTGANMFVDGSGNLWVPDVLNNRVLEFNTPFLTDTVADAVWGQTSFAGNGCNGTTTWTSAPAPTASTLCFWNNLSGGGVGAGVRLDAQGNLWVADGGNNRILRFPKSGGSIAKTADIVLGQSSFTSATSGSGLSQLFAPNALVFDAQGNMYVADTGNNRALLFKPNASGQFATGQTAASTFGTYPSNAGPVTLELDPQGRGIWTQRYNSWDAYLQLWDFNGNATSVPPIDQWSNSVGSIAFDTQNSLLFTTPRQENLWVSQSGSGRLPSEWYRAISAWS